MEKQNENFFSKWTDEQLTNVVIPIMGRLGMPELPVEHIRWLNNKDSESLFTAGSFPMDFIVDHLKTAVDYYDQQKNNGVAYDKESFIAEVWHNWDNLTVLLDSNKQEEEKNAKPEEPTSIHAIINNINNKKATENDNEKNSIYDRITKYLKGKSQQTNLSPEIAAMYDPSIKPDNAENKPGYDIDVNKYYGGEGR